MKPLYVVIHKGPRIGFSFALKRNAQHHARVCNAIGVVCLDSVNALRFSKQIGETRVQGLRRKLQISLKSPQSEGE